MAVIHAHDPGVENIMFSYLMFWWDVHLDCPQLPLYWVLDQLVPYGYHGRNGSSQGFKGAEGSGFADSALKHVQYTGGDMEESTGMVCERSRLTIL